MRDSSRTELAGVSCMKVKRDDIFEVRKGGQVEITF